MNWFWLVFDYIFHYSKIGRRQRKQFWDRLSKYPVKGETPWDNYLELVTYYPEDTPIWNGRYWEDSYQEDYGDDDED